MDQHESPYDLLVHTAQAVVKDLKSQPKLTNHRLVQIACDNLGHGLNAVGRAYAELKSEE